MTTTVKRFAIISLFSALFALVIFGNGVSSHADMQSAATDVVTQAAGTQAADLPTTKPVVRAELRGNQLAGLVGSSCWPGANPECDIVDDPQPDQPIVVANGDTLTIKIDPASPAPQKFEATLLDDKDTSGNAKVIDLATTKGEFKVDSLTDGDHRLQIDAIYSGDLSGSQPFVTYVYLLRVGQAGTSATSAATQIATQVATGNPVSATAAATLPSTAVATAASTVEATAAATAQSTAVSATSPATVAVNATSPATTAPAATKAATAKATSNPTVTTVSATANATQSAQLSTVSPMTFTPTTIVPPTIAAVTSAPTTVVPPTVVPAMTNTPVATELAATSTLVPAAGNTEAAVAPTVNVTPAVVIITATPGGTSVAPAMSVLVGGRSYEPIAVSACVLGDGGEQTCVNRPRNAVDERILAAPGDVAQINFKGPHPTSVTIYLATSDGTTIVNKQTVKPDNLMLYNLPTTPGSFVLSVEISWPTGKSTYYYRLNIGG